MSEPGVVVLFRGARLDLMRSLAMGIGWGLSEDKRSFVQVPESATEGDVQSGRARGKLRVGDDRVANEVVIHEPIFNVGDVVVVRGVQLRVVKISPAARGEALSRIVFQPVGPE